MKLYVMRHGPAEDHHAAGDAARALTTSGRERVRQVAELLVTEGEAPKHIVSSPLVRALQTAEIVHAQAKVGAYAFTTLVPKLGVVRHRGREFVLADIPGLIEGAAEGAGIGDRFLGHIERCRVLIHLIDIGGVDPVEALRIVEDELAAYGEGLDDKPRLIALNKIDLADAELAGDFAKELKAAGATRVFPISTATGEGIGRLLDAVLDHLPGRTATETKGSEIEDAADAGGEWSPI